MFLNYTFCLTLFLFIYIRIPWKDIGLVPSDIAQTVCEYLDYLPQTITITFDSIANYDNYSYNKDACSSQVFVDCIDFNDDWIMMHENRKNISYCRCIKLNWNEILCAIENDSEMKKLTIVV